MLSSVLALMPHGVMAVVTVLVVMAVVLVHYQGLAALTRALGGLPERPRPRILFMILALLVLHGLEVLLFGAAYFACVQGDELGRIVAPEDDAKVEGLLDFGYFSAVVYTTVGFGEIVPQGPVRGLVGAEGITGLTLITWSASFTFLEMQQHWRLENRSR